MQNQEKCGASCEFDDWSNFEDEDIMQQQSDIKAEEAQKVPFVADKVSANQAHVLFCFILLFILWNGFFFFCSWRISYN